VCAVPLRLSRRLSSVPFSPGLHLDDDAVSRATDCLERIRIVDRRPEKRKVVGSTPVEAAAWKVESCDSSSSTSTSSSHRSGSSAGALRFAPEPALRHRELSATARCLHAKLVAGRLQKAVLVLVYKFPDRSIGRAHTVHRIIQALRKLKRRLAQLLGRN
jgi:hypothetical protein